MTDYVYRFPELPTEQFLSGLDLHRIVGSQMAVIYAKWAQGTRHERIIHENEEFFFVLTGSLDAEVGDEQFQINPSDGLLIPGGIPHSFTALEDCVVLTIFAPPITHEEAERLKNDI